MHDCTPDITVQMRLRVYLSSVLVLGLLAVTDCNAQDDNYNVKPRYDVCNPQTEITDPNSVYLPGPDVTTVVYVNIANRHFTNVQCLLYFKTCQLCRIRVDVVQPFDYPKCTGSLPDNDYCIPNCVDLYLFDGDYKNQTAKRISNSSSIAGYKSESGRLFVIACGGMVIEDFTMSLRLTVEEKVQEISGSALRAPYQTFMSPFFPYPYAKNSEYYRYDFKADGEYELIEVSFDDWLLAPSSTLQFERASNTQLVRGNAQRPFVVSSGSSMTMVFSTGDRKYGDSNYLGFKAVARFYANRHDIANYSTACDHLNGTSEGGVLYLERLDGVFRDCIWIIKKVPDYDGVYLKLLSYRVGYDIEEDDTTDFSLEIVDGITSTANVLLNIRPVENTRLYPIIHYSETGYYIRIKGRYYADDSVVLAYSMYLDFCDNPEVFFKCNSGRCIPASLKCDSFDHCGDSSDELPDLCSAQTLTRPSSSSAPVSITIIIPLVVSVFLVIVMCLLIIFIRRCRRLSNTANGRRPHARQNRSRHHRHGVQMSVTLSSGDHPPSYDEVIQNTPIGYLNMAFTWSQHGNIMSQPPTYEEAISPTAAQLNGGTPTAAASSSVIRGDTSASSATIVTATLSASLDPRAEVSSSSSSEDAADHYRHLDMSSSSDTSTDSEHPVIPNHSNIEHSRSTTNLSKISKDSDNGITSQGNVPKHASTSEGVQIVLEPPASLKYSTDSLVGVSSENIRRKEDSKNYGSPTAEAAKNQHNEIESRDRLKQATEVRGGPSSNPLEIRHENQRSGCDNRGFDGDEGRGGNERDRNQGRERSDMYRKHKSKHSELRERSSRPSEGGYRQQVHPSFGIHLPRVTDSSRSQSCADLSWGSRAEGRLDVPVAGMRDEDKRFSYAGAGDVSLTRGNFDPFYKGRGLVREKPVEHLDKYSSQSYNNLRDDYRARRHRNREYEVTDVQSNSAPSKHSHAADHTGDYHRRMRDKSELQRSNYHHHAALAPVQESLCDEPYGSSRLPDDMPRYRHDKDRQDRSRDHTSQDRHKWSQMPDSQSSIMGNTVYPPSVLKRSRPSDTSTSTSEHENLYPHNEGEYSHCDNRQRQPSHIRQNSKNMTDTQNPNQDSYRYIPTFKNFDKDIRNPQNQSDLWKHSADRVPHSEQRKTTQEAPMATPKPSLRSHLHPSQGPNRAVHGAVPKPASRTNIQASQRSDSEEPVPKPNPRTDIQHSQRPTPAPRNGIRKQSGAGASSPETHPYSELQPLPHHSSYGGTSQQNSFSGSRSPDYIHHNNSSPQGMNLSERPKHHSQHRQETRDTTRSRSDGSPGREERHSEHSPAQKTSNSQINLQATDDDVFV